MQRLTDVALTFRHANGVGDVTDLLWGQRLDAPRPEGDRREDRLEGLRRLRDGLPTEAETVLDRLPAVLEQDIDARVRLLGVRDGERGRARFEPHERGVHAGLRVKSVPLHSFSNFAGGPSEYADAQPRVVRGRRLCDHPTRELPLVHQDSATERLAEQAGRRPGRD